VVSKLDFLTISYGAPDLVVVGDAAGVDSQVRDWAREMSITVQVFEANWGLYGSMAGPVRNNQMITYAATCRDHGDDVKCFAFPGQERGGTHDCYDRARTANLKTVMFKWVAGVSKKEG